MKTFFAALGVVMLVGVVALLAGGLYAYKKGSSAVNAAQHETYVRYYGAHRDPPAVVATVHRLDNAAKLNSGWMSAAISMSVLGILTQPGPVTEPQIEMLEAAAKLAEDPSANAKAFTEYQGKFRGVSPTSQTYPTAPQAVTATPAGPH